MRQLTGRLRERILSGSYAPGSALRQDVIAAEYGTSKIPVREALVQLQSEGLVDIFPNRGFQVRPLVASELQEVFRLRLQMEPPAVSLGAKLANDEDRRAARQALVALNAAVDGGEPGASGAQNRTFHLALTVPRLQPVTAQVLGRLHTVAQRYVQAHLAPEGRGRRAAREHAALLKAWDAGRARTVRTLLHEHIESTRADLARMG